MGETTSSNAMEKLACIRSLDKLTSQTELDIEILCTDRHPGIKVMMEKDYPEVNYQADVWHLQKNVSKKLNAVARKAECRDLQPWIQSIANHQWYSSSTCGDDVVLLERWNSILHHVPNKHEWDGFQQVHSCGHKPLSDESERKKKWIQEESPEHLLRW